MIVNCQDNVMETINSFEWPSNETINNLSSEDDNIRISAAKKIVAWQCKYYQLGIMMNDIRNSSYSDIGCALGEEQYFIVGLNRIIRDISENKSLNVKKEDIVKFMDLIKYNLECIKENIEKCNKISDSNKESLKLFFDKCFELRHNILLSLK